VATPEVGDVRAVLLHQLSRLTNDRIVAALAPDHLRYANSRGRIAQSPRLGHGVGDGL